MSNTSVLDLLVPGISQKFKGLYLGSQTVSEAENACSQKANRAGTKSEDEFVPKRQNIENFERWEFVYIWSKTLESFDTTR